MTHPNPAFQKKVEEFNYRLRGAFATAKLKRTPAMTELVKEIINVDEISDIDRVCGIIEDFGHFANELHLGPDPLTAPTS